MRHLLIIRRLVQISVIVLFCALPWLAASGFTCLSGSLFAFDFFGLPFADPASTLQVSAGALSVGLGLNAMLLMGALVALLLAFFMGRIFCGWLCPYGFLSEIIYGLRCKTLSSKLGAWSTKAAFWGKACLLLIGIVCIIGFGYPLISLLSMPGELSLLPLDFWLGASFITILFAAALPLCALLAELIFGQRLWCSYVCPQSVLLGGAAWLLPKKFLGLKINYNPKKCICGKNSPCRDACSMKLNPRKKGGPERRDCLMCGDCLQACTHYGKALTWQSKDY